MMKLNKILASAALFASFGISTPLSAAVVQVQYTGTVSSGYDQTGVFGTAGTFLTGAAFTANYTFETTNGQYVNESTYNYVFGGDTYGYLTSPALSAAVTINGNTFTLSGNDFGQIYADNEGPGAFSQVYHHSSEYHDDGSSYYSAYVYTSIVNYSGSLPYSLTNPFSYSVTPGDYGYGQMRVALGHYDTGNYSYAYASLAPDHVTIGAPIPEPETYAMLLAGLGLLGFVARRRKLKLAAELHWIREQG